MGATKKYLNYLDQLKEKHLNKCFGNLIIIDVVKGNTTYEFLMICSCGKPHKSAIQNVLNNNCFSCKSCSAINRSMKVCKNVDKDLKSEYNCWKSMKSRCLDKNNIYFHRYGGKGITVHENWINSFHLFISDVGKKPTENHTLDRINNDGNYEPSNCKWSTRKEQADNRSTNVYLTAFGKTQNVIEWSRELGIHRNTIAYRYKIGKSHQDCLLKKV